MINKSKPVLISGHTAIRIALPAAAEYIRTYGRFLFKTVERLYDAHMVKAQMRLAPPQTPCKAASIVRVLRTPVGRWWN